MISTSTHRHLDVRRTSPTSFHVRDDTHTQFTLLTLCSANLKALIVGLKFHIMRLPSSPPLASCFMDGLKESPFTPVVKFELTGWMFEGEQEKINRKRITHGGMADYMIIAWCMVCILLMKWGLSFKLLYIFKLTLLHEEQSGLPREGSIHCDKKYKEQGHHLTPLVTFESPLQSRIYMCLS